MKAKKLNKLQIRSAPLRFIIRFFVTLVVAYALLHFTAPLANKVFTFFARNVVMALDGTGYTQNILAKGRYIVITYQASKKWDATDHTVEYKGYTVNMVFLVALIMAVPQVNYKLRLKILLLGLLILFPVQIFKFVIYVFNYYCQNMRRKSGAFIYPAYMHHAIGYADRIMWRIDLQIIPVIIWAGLFYYYKWHNIFTKLMKKRSS